MSDKKNQALFSIIFEVGTNYVGGNNYFETKWLEIPNKKIKRIFYKLPTGDYLLLNGFEKYYHMVEVTKDWIKVSKNKVTQLNNNPVLEYAYIMGKKRKKIISYRITLSTRQDAKYKIGDITIREFDTNNEKIRGLNPQGWK